jgi:hypothetical protein
LRFFADNERGSLQREVIDKPNSVELESHFQQRLLPPHLNPLPQFGGQVGANVGLTFSPDYDASERTAS